MARSRGIKLGRKLVRLFKWCIRRRTRRLQPPAGPISKLCKWISSLGCQAKRSLLCLGKSNPGYIRLGKDPIALPKGHLAVYVGEKEGSISRVVVPVLYFNHPLFGMLLQKAEKVHGFDHPGGIQIPCPVSELERVQMKIAAAGGAGVGRSRRRLLDYPLDSFLWYLFDLSFRSSICVRLYAMLSADIFFINIYIKKFKHRVIQYSNKCLVSNINSYNSTMYMHTFHANLIARFVLY